MGARPLLFNRRYECKRCGFQKIMKSTHKDNVHSWGDSNRCPVCKDKKVTERTVWVCLQK